MQISGALSADDLFEIAALALRSQDPATAEECLLQCATRARQSGQWGRELQALHRLADLLEQQNRLAEAVPILRDALDLYAQKVEYPVTQGTRVAGGPRHWLRLGQWCLEIGDDAGVLQAAHEHVRRIRRDYGQVSRDTAYGLDEAADLLTSVDPQLAESHRTEAHAIRLRIDAHQQLLTSAQLEPDREKALSLAQQYEREALTLYHLPSAAELQWVAELYSKLDAPELATGAWEHAREAHLQQRDWVPPALHS